MIRGAVAASSDDVAAEAAQAALDAAASAVDAVVAGFIAAGGAHPDVLFAPVVALVAGVGVGARAFDGRALQPGRGAKRPRGFVDGEEVPDGSFVAVPRSLGMLALLVNYFGRSSLRELVRAGVHAAQSRGASKRAALIRTLGDSGATVLRTRNVERALLAAGGPLAGGALTADDLAEALPAEADALTTTLPNSVSWNQVPWPPATSSRPSQAILASDARGVLAALAYSPAGDGVVVDDIEVVLGRDAVAVRRGVQRVSPGTPLESASPIAIVLGEGMPSLALALPGQPSIDPDATLLSSSNAGLEAALKQLVASAKAQIAVCVVADGRDARKIKLSQQSTIDNRT